MGCVRFQIKNSACVSHRGSRVEPALGDDLGHEFARPPRRKPLARRNLGKRRARDEATRVSSSPRIAIWAGVRGTPLA